MIEEHAERFTHRVFTSQERAHSHGRAASTLHLAARFAAKEATLKALGTGLARGITWQDVEVVATPEGKPELRLRGKALELARASGAAHWLLSLSHTRSHAIAMVVASR